MNRRFFVQMTGLGLLSRFRTEGQVNEKQVVHFYLGTYTQAASPALPQSKGIYRASLRLDTGELRLLGLVAAVENPSFLTISPNGRFLYAIHEADLGQISAFAIQQDGGLTFLNRQETKGPHPCFVSTDPTGKVVLVANYSGGNVASYHVEANGYLSEAVSVFAHTGRGGDPTRQTMPHAHAIRTAPNGKFAYAADLGTDKLYGYHLSPKTGELLPMKPHFLSTNSGSGPRHLAFSPDGKWLFLVNELDNTILSIRLNVQTGKMAVKAQRSALPTGFTKTSYIADVHLSPDGRYLYVSNRGHNSIFVGKINRQTGVIQPIQHISCGGDWPRNFGIEPSGRILLVANERSGNILSFHRNVQSGLLKPTGYALECAKPVCICFHKNG